MNLGKILYAIAIIFLILFVASVILIITNTLNMWLVGIISLSISIICCVIIKVTKKKSN